MPTSSHKGSSQGLRVEGVGCAVMVPLLLLTRFSYLSCPHPLLSTVSRKEAHLQPYLPGLCLIFKKNKTKKNTKKLVSIKP